MTFKEKCKLAQNAKSGDVWRNIKTRRKATVIHNSWRGLYLRPDSGRETIKQHHYFAGDFDPVKI